jgi:hypothetical protein
MPGSTRKRPSRRLIKARRQVRAGLAQLLCGLAGLALGFALPQVPIGPQSMGQPHRAVVYSRAGRICCVEAGCGGAPRRMVTPARCSSSLAVVTETPNSAAIWRSVRPSAYKSAARLTFTATP